MEKTLLNLIPGACSPEVHLSQYDKGRVVPFKLAEGKSAYSVPDGSEIVVQATKPSGLGFVVPVTFDGDTATMTITETMSNEYGRFPAELSITNNGNRIGTANFVMNIERSPHPEGTIDGDAESLLPELTLLVERIEAAADSVDEDTQIVTEAKAEVLQAKADTLQAKADTLTARDDALQAKADAITAKESAEASAQAAAEASERAEELIGSVSTKADAIVKTASGEIASFSDGGDDLPMKSLKVNIVPKQSGSGDPSPSNVRPISGYEGVNVTRVGKNLLPKFISGTSNGITYTVADDGTVTISGTATATSYLSVPCFIKKGQTITLSANNSAVNSGGRLWLIGQNYSLYMNEINKKATITLTADVTAYRIAFDNGATANGTIKPQVELGSTVTAYEPYQGTSYPISLGQTVYGGVLDVVSGKLIITHAKTVLDDSLTYLAGGTNTSGKNRFTVTALQSTIKKPASQSDTVGMISDRLKEVSSAGTWARNEGISVYTNGYVYIYIDSCADMDRDQFKTYMGNNPLTVVYPLATPTEITLTPTQVKTLLGNNNIFADSGSVEVEYRADTTLAYNELLSLIASLS